MTQIRIKLKTNTLSFLTRAPSFVVMPTDKKLSEARNNDVCEAHSKIEVDTHSEHYDIGRVCFIKTFLLLGDLLF